MALPLGDLGKVDVTLLEALALCAQAGVDSLLVLGGEEGSIGGGGGDGGGVRPRGRGGESSSDGLIGNGAPVDGVF
jgi:hypothetical protein